MPHHSRAENFVFAQGFESGRRDGSHGNRVAHGIKETNRARLLNKPVKKLGSFLTDCLSSSASRTGYGRTCAAGMIRHTGLAPTLWGAWLVAKVCAASAGHDGNSPPALRPK